VITDGVLPSATKRTLNTRESSLTFSYTGNRYMISAFWILIAIASLARLLSISTLAFVDNRVLILYELVQPTVDDLKLIKSSVHALLQLDILPL